MYYIEMLGLAILLGIVCLFVLKFSISKVVGFVVNAVLGCALIWALNYFNIVSVPINWITAAITGVFGIPGAVVLALLAYFKII